MADAVTLKLVAFLLKMTSIDPYAAAGEEYVNRHTREYFDMGLATTVLDAMNITCFGYHSGPTYQAYLRKSNSLKDAIGANGLIPGYAGGFSVAIVKVIQTNPKTIQHKLCDLFEHEFPPSRVMESTAL